MSRFAHGGRAEPNFLKPSGHFVLRIRTDFSCTHPKGSVSNNTRQAYVDLFSPLGRVVYVTDRLGNPLPDEEAARRSGKRPGPETDRGAVGVAL